MAIFASLQSLVQDRLLKMLILRSYQILLFLTSDLIFSKASYVTMALIHNKLVRSRGF